MSSLPLASPAKTSSSLSSEAIQEHIAQLAVAKPVEEDCAWIKLKAQDLWEFSGADRTADANIEDAQRRTQLISMGASESTLKALAVMTNKAKTMNEVAAFSNNHIEAVCNLLKLLRNLARDREESRRIVAIEGISVVKETILSLGKVAAVCRDAFGALANLANPQENRDRVLSDCGSVLTFYMKKHAGDVRVAQNGCACLLNISNDVSQLDQVGTVASDAIVEAGMIHARDATVAEHVESSLAALLLEKENASRLMADGSTAAVDLIVNLMRLHARDPIVCEHGLRCIYSLAYAPERKQLLVQCGCLSAVHLVMTSCNDPTVAEWGCKALRAFSHNSPEFKRTLHEAGATAWTMSVIRAHSTTTSVVKAGLATLWSLANASRNKSPMVLQENAHVVIINALRLVPDSPAVNVVGTAALASLANDSSVRKKLAQDGAITAVLHAMRGYQTHSLVAEYGCSCLWSLCMDKDVQLIAMRDSQPAKVVLEALTEHPNKLGVKIKALGALENMGGTEQGAIVMIQAGAVPIVASLLRMSLQVDENIVVRCCNVLAVVAYYSEDSEVFHKYGVAEIAVDVQRLHPGEDERCAKAAERLLTSMEGGRSLFPT